MYSHVQSEAMYSGMDARWMFRLWHFSNHGVVEVVFAVPHQIEPGSLFKGHEIVHPQVCQVW